MTDTRETSSTTPKVLKDGAALVSRSQRVFRLTGKDPVGMLNAILTNDVPKDAGRGVYAMLLNPKGRIQADLRVIRTGEDVLILTEPEGADAAKEILGRYAPFSRVKLEELSDWSVLGLYGTDSGPTLRLDLSEHESTEVEVAGETIIAVGVAAPIPGYDLLAPAQTLQTVEKHLTGTGAVPTNLELYETARIEAGVPRFGADITPDNFPGETGVLEQAVSFKKGCYPGQETVARMHYRGHPNKDLHRFTLERASATTGTEIVQNEKAVGLLTSVAPLTVDGNVYALGYLSRKADPEAPMTVGGVPLTLSGPVRD